MPRRRNANLSRRGISSGFSNGGPCRRTAPPRSCAAKQGLAAGSSTRMPTRLNRMKSRIGFILVTFNQPEQTLNLCQRLGTMFGDPPIAIHHDFSQTDLDRSRFPANVRFVEPWHRTGWGTIAVLNAQVAALRMLQRMADPDWCVSLSSTDYPIQTAEQILADLGAAAVDAFVDMRPVRDSGQRFVNEGLGELAFNHPRYPQSAFYRYVAIPLISRSLAHRLKQPQEWWTLASPVLTKRLTPFRDAVQCFGGDTWFTAGRQAMDLFVNETPLWRTLHRHFAKRQVPEEAFYQTLLGNSSGLRLSSNNLRYTDWHGCYAHPRLLGREDLPRLLQSTHHFARKFRFDPHLFAEIDQAVAQKMFTSPQAHNPADRDALQGPREWQFASTSSADLPEPRRSHAYSRRAS